MSAVFFRLPGKPPPFDRIKSGTRCLAPRLMDGAGRCRPVQSQELSSLRRHCGTDFRGFRSNSSYDEAFQHESRNTFSIQPNFCNQQCLANSVILFGMLILALHGVDTSLVQLRPTLACREKVTQPGNDPEALARDASVLSVMEKRITTVSAFVSARTNEQSRSQKWRG